MCVCICIYVYRYTYSYTCISIHVCDTYICIYIYMYIYYICIYYIYIYIYISELLLCSIRHHLGILLVHGVCAGLVLAPQVDLLSSIPVPQGRFCPPLPRHAHLPDHIYIGGQAEGSHYETPTLELSLEKSCDQAASIQASVEPRSSLGRASVDFTRLITFYNSAPECSNHHQKTQV